MGYERLKKGNICTVLIKYKNGNPIGLKRFYDNPTEIITILISKGKSVASTL